MSLFQIWHAYVNLSPAYLGRDIWFDFDFIECFTTTFLRAHSWLNWVDEDDNEDEFGLKERNKTRSTGSVDKELN